MPYKEIESPKPSLFYRLTGFKKEVFVQMLDNSVTTYKQSRRKHISRGVAGKLSYADKVSLLLLYFREYRTQFHIGITCGISESRVCEIIQGIEHILMTRQAFSSAG